MNLLQDIITYIRRIIKSASNQDISDYLLIDYINRFWLMDVDARIQVFDLKTKYEFQTTPGIDEYNMPLYNIQVQPVGPGDPVSNIGPFPVYQGFTGSAYVNGIPVSFYTERSLFEGVWPSYVQQQFQVGTGDGGAGPYTLNLPFFPALPGHVDLSGIIAYGNLIGNYSDPILVTNAQILASAPFIQSVPSSSVSSKVYFTATGANGQNVVIADSGQFLAQNTDQNLYGLLMRPGIGVSPGGGNFPLVGAISAPTYSTTQNTINYNTGVASNVYFPASIPAGTPINAQCYFIEQGIPRSILYYNNVIKLRAPPNTQYLVSLDAYLTPAAFLNTSSAIPFGYMAEYIARGAARKILSDTGDVEQFQFYEQFFREQEMLVWKRSQRQFTSTRTETIYSNSGYPFGGGNNNSSMGT